MASDIAVGIAVLAAAKKDDHVKREEQASSARKSGACANSRFAGAISANAAARHWTRCSKRWPRSIG